MNTQTDLLYCYAITRELPKGVLTGVRGIRGSEVDTIECAGVLAVASEVPEAEFNAEALSASLENLEWLGETARTHNDVVTSVARVGPTLPCRLATVYLDRQRVAEVLRAGAAAFTTALDRLQGRTEWGVKVYQQPPSPSTPAPARTPERDGADRSGRAYLRRRAAQRDSADDAMRSAVETADEVDRVLGELADDRRRHNAQSAELSGAQGRNVLNAAYLVSTEGEGGFHTRVRELQAAAQGCRVELTGPWVPYSFVPDGPESGVLG